MSQLSIRSEESIQQIAAKTRSKIKITEPIEKIVKKEYRFWYIYHIWYMNPYTLYKETDLKLFEKFKPPDYEEPSFTAPATRDHDYYSFLNDTFIHDVEHGEDDEDADFNPNEFLDDLLDLTKEISI